MRLLVVDTETTGDSETDQVIELSVRASVRSAVKPPSRWEYHSLYRPTCEIHPAARAAHHLTDEQLANHETFLEKLEEEGRDFAGLRDGSDDDVFVAHFAAFDRRMLVQSAGSVDLGLPKKEICTWKCAQNLWPDAPGYKNQVLRYWLKLDVPHHDNVWMQPHRAHHDTLVTELLVERMLQERSVEELIELTKQPVLIKTCKFGEHSGKPWSEVPQSFLSWVLARGPRRPDPRGGRDIGFDEDVRHTCQHWLDHHRAAAREKY